MPDHYTYRVSWSEEDQEFVGTCFEFPSLSHLDENRHAALEGIEALVRDVVADMERENEVPPVPIADQRFSGNFQTRVPSDLHRRLTLEAAEAGVSLNRLVSYKLTIPATNAAPAASKRTKMPA